MKSHWIRWETIKSSSKWGALAFPIAISWWSGHLLPRLPSLWDEGTGRGRRETICSGGGWIWKRKIGIWPMISGDFHVDFTDFTHKNRRIWPTRSMVIWPTGGFHREKCGWGASTNEDWTWLNDDRPSGSSAKRQWLVGEKTLGFFSWGDPQSSSIFNGIFADKPSILRYPHGNLHL